MQEVRAHVALLEALAARKYRFITPTPLTHARVMAGKDPRQARDLRDVLGWSLPFAAGALEAEIVAHLRAIDALEDAGAGLVKSRVRVSSLGDQLFLHSAYPTTQHDAVFFGPDSYRFAAFLRAELPRFGRRKGLIDIGSGSGVGAIVAAPIALPEAIWFNDINEKALHLAMANAWFAGTPGNLLFPHAGDIAAITGEVDAIIANPPYLIDPAGRTYRDGGAMLGAEASLAWTRAAAARLSPGGVFLLYTGSAIVAGEDAFKAAAHEALAGFAVSYQELDPDVFGEELERGEYAGVERIAAVGMVGVKL